MDHHVKIRRKALKSGHTAPLRAGMRAEHAAQVILRGHAAEFARQLASLATPDVPEAVHQSRVVVRRFRAALQAFAPVIDPGLRRDLGKRLRDLFQMIGKVRDAEVLAEQRVDETQRARLAARAAKRRRELCKSLKSRRVERLAKSIDVAFDGKPWRNQSDSARALRKGPVEVLAGPALDRAWLRAMKVGPDLPGCSAKARHDLRKRLKAFRYMAEDLAPLWSGEASRPLLGQLRVLQEDLGLLNDMAIAQAHGLTPDRADSVAALARADSVWSDLQTALPWWRSAPVTGP